MADLLFLTHRMPYPPEKGDKIRSWHILRHLAARHRIHLGCFYDDPDDARHIATLAEICASLCCLPLNKLVRRVTSFGAFRTGGSLSATYFHSPLLERWIAETVTRHRPSEAFVYCSAMAPYLENYQFSPRVIDMVDVDSEKWAQYANESRWPLEALYRREAKLLLDLEKKAALDFDWALLSTPPEAALFLRRAKTKSARIIAMRNGVDHAFFDPSVALPSPYAAGRKTVVFTGAMDYRPNIEAAQWFAAEVMTMLRHRFPTLDFWIVGAHPVRALRALAGGDIHVTGRVPDMRPYLAHADVVVAPLLIARGVQNKVLEGMAMARPVVATPRALEGLDLRAGSEILAADSAPEFARAVAAVLNGAVPSLGRNARERIVADYGWPAALAVLDRLFPDAPPALASAS